MSNPESDGVRNNFEGQNFNQGDGQLSQQAANTYSDGGFQQLAANDRVNNALASEQMAKNGQLGNLEITGDNQSKAGAQAENSQINSNESKSLEGSEEIQEDTDKAGKDGKEGQQNIENLDSNGQKDGEASRPNSESTKDAMNDNPLDNNRNDTITEAPSSEIDPKSDNSIQDANNIKHFDMPNNSQKQMADGSPAGVSDKMPPDSFGSGADGKGGPAPEAGKEPGKDQSSDGTGSIVNDRNDKVQENNQLFGDQRNSVPAQSKANDQVNNHGKSSQEHSETLDPEFSPESNGEPGKSAPHSQTESQKEKMDFSPESNRNKEGDNSRDAAGQSTSTNSAMGANRMGGSKLPVNRPRW
ncbi:MAG: hypothetical protein K2Y32_00885 [Candidatus Obscuribacterales bacterium]|nr:hypothetical protein [Candidatus Obscuribacterales bacterium]